MFASSDDDSRLVNYYKRQAHDELHIFARSSGAVGSLVLGEWARRVAVDYLKNASTVKAIGAAGTPSVIVNDAALKDLLRDALLIHGVAVNQHDLSGGSWNRVKRGSPGNLGDFEGLIFEFAAGSSEVATASQLAITVRPATGAAAGAGSPSAANGSGPPTTTGGNNNASANTFHFACAVVNGTLRQIIVGEFVDDASAQAVDAIICQNGVKEVLIPDDMEGGAPVVFAAMKRIAERSSGVKLRIVPAASFAGSAGSPTRRKSTGTAATSESTKYLAARITPLLRSSHAASAAFDLHAFPDACTAVACLIDESGVLDAAEPTNLGAFTIRRLSLTDALRLDVAAVGALDLVDTGSGKASSASSSDGGGATVCTSVLGWLNRTMTGMGGRLMRQYLLQPLRNVDSIHRRQCVVEALAAASITRDRLRHDVLRHLSDLDRLNRRLQRGTASLKEIFGLNNFIDVVPVVCEVLRGYTGEHQKLMVDEFVSPFTDIGAHLSNLRTLLESTLVVDKYSPKINPDFDDELFTLHEQLGELNDDAKKETTRLMNVYGWSEKLLRCEPASNGGLLFRVSRKEDKPVRDAGSKVFRIYSTSKEGVKFATAELDRISTEMRKVQGEYELRQRALHLKLVETVSTYVPLLDDARDLLAQLDVFAAWALVVSEASSPMVRPQMLEPADSVKLAGGDVDVLDLRAVRHPLVEQRQGGRFVGNDVVLGGRDGGALWIVTGPNMGGKSTLMRSVGIALVLAHAGCFVPADKATLTIRDSIQCRVGAVDYLSSGLSTFMVEMLESSAILHNATPQSFVMIDELGRGTSTFDGFGIAWAIAEELAARKRCQALFASHFHELCELEGKHPDAVRNVHVTAEQVEPTTAGGTPGLKFLYRLANGPSRRSFGVHVAKLAGMPAAVVDEARSKAAELESSVAQPSPPSGVVSSVKTEGAAEFDAPSLSSCLLADERSALLKAVAAVAAPSDATLTETGALASFAAALRGVVQRLDPDTVATA